MRIVSTLLLSVALGLTRWHLTLAILGFNVGIELMQLVVVALVAPWLLVLARTPLHAPLRICGALGAGVAAVGWIGQRALHWHNPIEAFVTSAAHHVFVIVIVLAGTAAVARAAPRVHASTS